MVIEIEEILKQIALYCRLTQNMEGYKVIYHLLDGNTLDYEEQDLNHILINVNLPRWSVIKQVKISDIN